MLLGAWASHLKRRETPRDGSVGYEFQVSVLATPQHDLLSTVNLPSSEVNYLVNPSTGAGIYFELCGYGLAHSCHIKFHSMPFLEFYVPIRPDECVVQDLGFTKSKKEDLVCEQLVKKLNAAKGNVHAFASVLISYLNASLSTKSAAEKEFIKKHNINNMIIVKQCIVNEVITDAIDAFAQKVDLHYKRQLEQSIGFRDARHDLVSEEDMLVFYNEFRDSFPIVHFAINQIVSSCRFDGENPSNLDWRDEYRDAMLNKRVL